MGILRWPEFTRIDVALTATVLLLAFLILPKRQRIPKGLNVPPGPPGTYFVGNALDMPTHHAWEKYTQWAKEYGDLVHIKVFGQHMVFVNSMEMARELFDRRSSIYSDRLEMIMINELMGFDWSFALMRYGQRWRRHRRTFHQYFHPNASSAYHDVQSKHTQNMIRSLHKSPEDFTKQIRHHVGATIVDVVYGIEVLSKDDPYIDVAEKALLSLAEAGNPGSFLVDIFPILKFVPEWMPGAGFQKKARVWKKYATELVESPFLVVKQALGNGTARPSFITHLLEDLSKKTNVPEDQEEIIRNAGAVAYGAGADTIVSVMSNFILAMVLYPEVQRKAQNELDSIVGMGRLPTFDDRTNLPYVNALYKEVLRWHPVLPLGVPHTVTQNDVYGRFFIPGGSLVIGNTWAILHNEKTYGPHCEEFRPERFIGTEAPDPVVAFGFGRRICPGRYLASNSVFLAIAYILQVFDISHAKDNNGKKIPVKDSITSGLIVHPEPFQCSIVPRSASAERLI